MPPSADNVSFPVGALYVMRVFSLGLRDRGVVLYLYVVVVAVVFLHPTSGAI